MPDTATRAYFETAAAFSVQERIQPAVAAPKRTCADLWTMRLSVLYVEVLINTSRLRLWRRWNDVWIRSVLLPEVPRTACFEGVVKEPPPPR